MRKRCFLFFSVPILLGFNLLTTNLLAPLPALADDDKDQTAGDNSVYRGLSGQRVPANINTLPMTNGLPATNLDSFVYQAGAMADQIYGDESIQGQPEFSDGFTANHRINAGINGINSAGLTTGHGSLMPSAWGQDEFLAAPGEWCTTGAIGYAIPSAASNAAQAASAIVSAVWGEVPGAMGSMGQSDASGLGRVMGMPNASIMPPVPPLPGLPALPSMSMPVPVPLPGPFPLAPAMPAMGLPPMPGLPPISSMPIPINGVNGGGQIAFANGINLGVMMPAPASW